MLSVPDPDIGCWHHRRVLIRSGLWLCMVGVVSDQLGHRRLHPLVTLRIGSVIAHDRRDFSVDNGQPGTVRHHLEVVHATQQSVRSASVRRCEPPASAMVRCVHIAQ